MSRGEWQSAFEDEYEALVQAIEDFSDKWSVDKVQTLKEILNIFLEESFINDKSN